jgi:hypothetical protein
LEGGRRARLAPQPLTTGGIADVLRRDSFERHCSPSRESSARYTTPIPFTEHAANDVVTDPFGQILTETGRGLLDEIRRPIVRGEKRQHLAPHRVIVCGACHEAVALFGGQLDRAVEKIADACPGVRDRPGPDRSRHSRPSSSRRSHALAIVQCRFTVAGEMPSDSGRFLDREATK